MKVAIRVDASNQIGTGHFMRCLSLAEALTQRDAQVRFISRDLPVYFQDMLTSKGYEFAFLSDRKSDSNRDGLAHSHWLGTSQDNDAQDSLRELSDQTWDWLVVDHYAVDARWQSRLRKAAANILVIDDIADRQHDCDVLLDQNFYTDMASRYNGKVPAHCRLLLGPRYALLRDEFRQLRNKVKPRNGPIKRLLVFFGGMDAADYTSRTIDLLLRMDMKDVAVDVVIGQQHPRRQHIETTCADHGFDCHVQTTRMAELMMSADMAIGAGGGAIWERCCLGLPGVTIATADNQHRQVSDAARAGLLYSPSSTTNWSEMMMTHIAALCENDNLRQFMSTQAMAAVDGRGIQRILRTMGCHAISLRIANTEDSQRLFEWRNHPDIRKVSHNKQTISWEEHKQWFTSVLSASEKVLLIGEKNNIPVGVVRCDGKGDYAEISIYLVPEKNHSGYGMDLLLNAERWIKTNMSQYTQLRATVLSDNERSHNLFRAAEYTIESTHYIKPL